MELDKTKVQSIIFLHSSKYNTMNDMRKYPIGHLLWNQKSNDDVKIFNTVVMNIHELSLNSFSHKYMLDHSAYLQ